MGYAPFVPRYGFEDVYPQAYVEVSPNGPWYSEEQQAVYWQQDQLSAAEDGFFLAQQGMFTATHRRLLVAARRWQQRSAARLQRCGCWSPSSMRLARARWQLGFVAQSPASSTRSCGEDMRQRYSLHMLANVWLGRLFSREMCTRPLQLKSEMSQNREGQVQDMTAADRERDEEGLEDEEGEGCSQSFADILGPNCVIKRVDKDQKVIGHAAADEMQQELVARAATQKRLGACAEHVHHLPRKEKLQWALDLKDKANECYAQSRFEEAARLYNDCLVALDFDGKEDETAEVVAKLQLPVCTNLAACLIEMGKYGECGRMMQDSCMREYLGS
eukprot:s3923_g8.t2